MNRSRTTLAAFLVVVTTVGVLAAVQAEPSPEMKKLEFMVGKGKGTRKAIRTPEPPQVRDITCETTWALGDRYLQHRVLAQRPDGSRGDVLVLITHDRWDSLYRMWIFSSGRPVPLELKGRFEGAKLVLTAEQPPTPPAFTGVGAVLEPQPSKEGYAQVHAVLPDSPAAQAGMKVGDLLIRIDGTTTNGMTSDQAVERIRGQDGTRVRVAVRSGDQEREVTLTRRMIQPPTPPEIRHIFEPKPGSGYLHLIESRAADGFIRAVEETVTVSR